MLKRLVCWLAGAVLVLLSSAYADGPDSTAIAPDEWAGRLVVAKSPAVVLREVPEEKSAMVPLPLTGVRFEVERKEGDWLKVGEGWLPTADVVRDEGVVEYFTAQLAQGERVFSYLGRARGWLTKNEFDKAQADIGEALRLEPQNARAYYLRGRIAFEQQRNDDALAAYDHALQLDPRDAIVLATRGELLMDFGEHDRAVRDFELAIELCPSDSRSWAARGWCRASKGEFEKAFADLAEAVRRNPRDASVRALRAATLLQGQQYPQVLEEAQRAVQLDPTAAEGFAVSGAVYLLQGKVDDALRDLNEAIRLGLIDDATTYDYRGYVHYLKGNLDAAVLDYTQAISLSPHDPEHYFNRGAVWSSKADYANAVIDLTECLRLQPDNADAYVARGHARLNSSLDEAMQDYLAAAKRNPRNVGALVGQAEVWSRRHDQEKAIEALTAAIDIAPGIADTYERRARIRMARGEHDLAIDDLTGALRIEPKKTASLYLRSMEWSQQGAIQKALDDCRSILSYEPKNVMAYYYMAMAHSRAGQPDEAIADLDAALRADPQDAQIRFLRANELFDQGKLDRALAGVDDVIRSGKNVSDAYGWRGYFWMRMQDWQKAIADYSEAIRLKPGNAHLLARRAMCRIGSNELDQAMKDADDALRLDPKSEEAAIAHQQALAAKNGAAYPHTATTDDEDGSFVSGGTPVVPSYSIDLKGPVGLKVAFENGIAEEFGPQTIPLPHRMLMLEGAMSRLKLVSFEGDAAKGLYMRVESARLSSENAALLKKIVPPLSLTKDDLDAASSGAEVVKLLVIVSGDQGESTQPEFEVLTSTETRRGAELLAEAMKRGAVIAALDLSQRPPPLTPLLRSPPADGELVRLEQCVRFLLDGPKGLKLAHEARLPGKFDEQRLPMPSKYAFPPGATIRFQFTGARVPAGPLYGRLAVSPAWPTELGSLDKTELEIVFSEADLQAASAGNSVTRVSYLAKQVKEQESSRIETLSSTALPPGSDAVAEASRRGTVLAIFKLSRELPSIGK